MFTLVVAALVVIVAAFVASVVVFGYPALIIGALTGVVLAFVAILALTADGLFPQTGAGSH